MMHTFARAQKPITSTLFFLALVFQSLALATGSYPEVPELAMTPGKLCESTAVKRYPEHIAYCERNVSSDTKNAVIAAYDQKFGYQILKMNRADFKIDHFIPLSIGGSNSAENLWPQYKKVYEVTDPIEQALSDKISQGRIKQDEAVRLIREVKLDLSKADEITHQIDRL